MTGPVGKAGALAGTRPTADVATAKLRKAAADLEAVFLAHVFQAMRETVPQNGMLGGGSGQAMFTAMLDDRFAALEAGRLRRGLTDALVRQLAPHVLPARGPQGR
jgi:Rod binding domain-containing protein